MGAQTQGQPGQMQLKSEGGTDSQTLMEILDAIKRRNEQAGTGGSGSEPNTKTLPGGLPAPPVPKGLPNPAVALNGMAGGGKSGGKG